MRACVCLRLATLFRVEDDGRVDPSSVKQSGKVHLGVELQRFFECFVSIFSRSRYHCDFVELVSPPRGFLWSKKVLKKIRDSLGVLRFERYEKFTQEYNGVCVFMWVNVTVGG